jgi:hypothetical protein
MRKYSQLPHSVDAVQWIGYNDTEIKELLGTDNMGVVPETKVLIINFGELGETVNPMDWVCIGDDLKVYIIPNYVFIGVYHGAFER